MNVNRFREEAPWTGSASNVACIEISLWSWPLGPDNIRYSHQSGHMSMCQQGWYRETTIQVSSLFRDGAFFIFQPFFNPKSSET